MYYACYQCHSDLADHDAEAWPSSRRGELAAMCGVCETALSASEYIGADACPVCDSSFNPDCADHYHIYFEWIDDAEGG